jgi:hypothetical protein
MFTLVVLGRNSIFNCLAQGGLQLPGQGLAARAGMALDLHPDLALGGYGHYDLALHVRLLTLGMAVA